MQNSSLHDRKIDFLDFSSFCRCRLNTYWSKYTKHNRWENLAHKSSLSLQRRFVYRQKTRYVVRRRREARRQFKRESSVERKHDNGDVHPRVEPRWWEPIVVILLVPRLPREFVLLDGAVDLDGKSCL